MRKHISIQPESDKPQSGKFSIKKVLTIAILFVLLMGTVGVMASSNRVRSVKILLSSPNETNFLNGVLVTYYKNDIFYSNKKITKDVNLLAILASNSVFCLKLAVFFLLLSLFFFIKRI